tara:strand:- start:20041 stop:20349 length:309 start_codon:yes stop_codon:yes gene_type:complete
MGKLKLYKCTKCGKYTFPKKIICSVCGGIDFILQESSKGTIMEISTIRHMLGNKDWKPRKIANVQTEEGVVLTAGIDEELEEGDIISLSLNGEAPIGQKFKD